MGGAWSFSYYFYLLKEYVLIFNKFIILKETNGKIDIPSRPLLFSQPRKPILHCYYHFLTWRCFNFLSHKVEIILLLTSKVHKVDMLLYLGNWTCDWFIYSQIDSLMWSCSALHHRCLLLFFLGFFLYLLASN